VDTWAAVWIALMTCGTMFPMSVYSGKILLQTTPSHIIGQLDKCLREASTLDGVLEFRHEHFWTVAFGTMAGSVHVRIRRDADEQMVLAHVYNRLSNLISVLTVQIFKDDWSRPPTSFQILGDTSSIPSSTRIPPLGRALPSVEHQFSGITPSGVYHSPHVAEHQHVVGNTPYVMSYGSTGAATIPLGNSEEIMTGHVPAAGRTVRVGAALPYAPRYPVGPSYVTGSSFDVSQGGNMMLPDTLQLGKGMPFGTFDNVVEPTSDRAKNK